MSGVNNFPDGVAFDAVGYTPNVIAPERPYGEYKGEQLSWVGGPAGPQPITSTNPDGDYPGVPASSPGLPAMFVNPC
jgi:hypothetical protein